MGNRNGWIVTLGGWSFSDRAKGKFTISRFNAVIGDGRGPRCLEEYSGLGQTTIDTKDGIRYFHLVGTEKGSNDHYSNFQ